MNPPPPKPNAELLESIFPPCRILLDQIGGCAPELYDYRREFGDRTWQEVSDDTYDTYSDVYCLMDHETLIHFIAGFMRYPLSEDDPCGGEYLILFAATDPFCDFCRLLNGEQLGFVIAFVDHYICHAFYADEDRERYQKNRRKLLQGPQHGGAVGIPPLPVRTGC
jgi:hypothetical protein